MTRRIAWILPLLATTGCATLKPAYSFTGMGEVDPARDREVIARMTAAHDDKSSATPEVKVLLNTVPEGIDMSGNTIKVEPGYAHRILGRFGIAQKSGLFYLVAGFFDYEDTWRKGVCYWQVPLEWLTVGFWSVVPTSYVCHPSLGLRDKADVVTEVKKAAAAAGADMVIMSFLAATNDEANGALGLLVRMDPRFKSGGMETKPIQGPPQGLTAQPELPTLPEQLAAESHR